MRHTTLLNRSLGLQGLWVRGVDYQPQAGRLIIDVVCRARPRTCARCGRVIVRVKDYSTRHWRHLDLWGVKTFLRARIARLVCWFCGATTQPVPWAAHRSRFTYPFERQVAWLAQKTDLTAVSRFFRITWRSTHRIIRRVVSRKLDDSRLDGLRLIGIDEISYRRRHRYLTLVVDHVRGRVVWARDGRKAKVLRRFFWDLGPQRRHQLQAVSMDMWRAYIHVVRRFARQARIVFDRFHIVRYLNDAVDQVRRELVATLEGEARRNLKHTKFPLLRSRQSCSPHDRRVLEDQVRANRPLYRAWLLKDDFMDLYTYKQEAAARRFLEGWLQRATRSGLKPIQRVARLLQKHLDGVVAWVRWPISNSRVEGTNNRIRLLSHRSFGVHSAQALIGLVYLCCAGIDLEPIH